MARNETSVTRWDPFRELAAWGSSPEYGRPSWMGRFMDDALRDRPAARNLAPAIDVTETESHYSVSAELPGVRKDDVHVELHEGVLTIRGEKHAESTDEEKGRWRERTYGTFSRAFRLPEDADDEQVKAEFADGVLRIRVGKRPEAKPRTVAVQ